MNISGKELKIIGHRGAAALEPENTLLSFQKAIDLGCEMIETDARLSVDGKVVLIHDKKVNRATNGQGLVEDKSLYELKKLDAGKGETIPTLTEAWDLIKDRVGLSIEIKEKAVLEEVILFIEKGNIKDQVLVSSRYYWLLAKMKKSNPALRTGVVAYVPTFSIWQARQMEAESLHPVTFITTSKLVQKAHRNNLKVYPFPYGIKPEKPEDIKKLISLGVDGIFLNDPTVINKI